MESNELRIGNLIKTNGVVVAVDARTIFDFDSDNRIKEPIYLTPEWLEKFGFKHSTPFGVDQFSKGKMWFFYDDEENRYSVNFYNNLVVEIKYVHQLQNLYYALTSTELKTK